MPNSQGKLKTAVISAAVAFSLIALTACAPQAAQQSGNAQAARYDGVVNVSLPGSVSTLNVARETGILNYYIAQLSSEGLLGVNTHGQLVPALASSYSTEDAQTWVFQIRQDARFHNGAPVTVDDVLFSIDIARDPQKSPSSSVYWPTGMRVERSGEWEITIVLPQPTQNFGWTVTANGGLWVTQKSFYEAATSYGSSQDLIIGTGPYQVSEFQPDSHATFTRSDSWRGDTPEAESIEFNFFSDENARLLALQSGDVDIALQVPAHQIEQYSQVAGTTVNRVSDRSYVGLTFDEGVAPFDDIHVRRAVAHAVEREAIVSTVLAGEGVVATGLEAPEQLGTEIGVEAAEKLLAGLPNVTYDMDAAARELAASSHPQGFDAELLYPTSVPQLGTAALAIADNLKKLGINLTVTAQPVEEWITTLGTGEYGISWMSYTPTTGDAAEIPGWLLGPSNPARYRNDEVQTLISESNAVTDPLSRAEKLIQANDIAQREVIYSPVWWGQSATVFASTVSAQDFSSFYFMTPWVLNLQVNQ